MEKYVKINRQIRFEDSGGNSEQKIGLVWWADYVNSTEGTGAIVGAYRLQYKTIAYFDEPEVVTRFRRR